jgi:hypothetical protein
MDLRLAFYAYWAFGLLLLSALTVWAMFKGVGGDFSNRVWLIPVLFVEAAIGKYLFVKIGSAIHRHRPHLFASAAETELYITSTRDGAAFMMVVTSIGLVLMAVASVALFMATFMGLYDAGDPPHWAEALAALFWIGYISFFLHILHVWYMSIRLAVFNRQRTVELD